MPWTKIAADGSQQWKGNTMLVVLNISLPKEFNTDEKRAVAERVFDFTREALPFGTDVEMTTGLDRE